MKVVTGLGCPGCGLTRSVTSAAHAKLGEAFRYHIFGPAILLATVAAWFAFLIGRKVPIDHPRTAKILLGLVFVLMAYWIVRILLGAVP